MLPDVDVHFSTQAGITNYAAATMAYNLGAKRVVLARELTLTDIARSAITPRRSWNWKPLCTAPCA